MSDKDDTKKIAISYNIIMVGDMSAGKTCLVNRFLDDNFTLNQLPTIGFEKYTKMVEINGLSYKLDIMDTTGQERYAALGVQYFRNADGALLVYDVTQKSSYQNIEKWLKRLNENNADDIPVAILQNKIDIEKEKWEVSEEDLQNLKDRLNIDIFLVSAKTGENVEDAFLALAKKVIEKNKDFEKKARIKLSKGRAKKKGCC